MFLVGIRSLGFFKEASDGDGLCWNLPSEQEVWLFPCIPLLESLKLWVFHF
uniref:Uncharacterized protein n=1 Tax=Physcomitrium patens TaxID=3218 RepID=A0A2K1IGR0_PHYPA|nr:hypothetical protein PHYPA_029055 [Physcomitrium patens]